MTDDRKMFPYQDPTLTIVALAEQAGIQPSAVDELRERISDQTAKGQWQNVRGEIVNIDTKQSADEFVGSLAKTHPHYWLSQDATDLAELAFGERPTLKARAEFIKNFGETNYEFTRVQWGCDHSLRAGKRPGPTTDSKGAKIAPEGASSNPWSPHFSGGDRYEAMAKFIRMSGSAASARMAKAAGSDIAGRPLRT